MSSQATIVTTPPARHIRRPDTGRPNDDRDSPTSMCGALSGRTPGWSESVSIDYVLGAGAYFCDLNLCGMCLGRLQARLRQILEFR